VEAGLRSFNKRMPEEINRILTDHVSSLLLCPTRAAVANLAGEGINHGVHHVGDVMYDAALVFGEIAEHQSSILRDLGLVPKRYLLATVHRAENTDNEARLNCILSAFSETSEQIVLPVHPRTRARLDSFDLKSTKQDLMIIDPVSFLDMVQLEKNARVILTDSGGVQKEAYFHGVPCVTLRNETEWVETVAAGWNQVVGADAQKIIAAVHHAQAGNTIDEYGQGRSSEYVLRFLIEMSCVVDRQIY
jgi:UDP-GlcNAc3NAcA epimerase